jgi:hypothetical protein
MSSGRQTEMRSQKQITIPTLFNSFQSITENIRRFKADLSDETSIFKKITLVIKYGLRE